MGNMLAYTVGTSFLFMSIITAFIKWFLSVCRSVCICLHHSKRRLMPLFAAGFARAVVNHFALNQQLLHFGVVA
ncbi:hypothetical protein, partial [Conchiformibius steedae]|uniref:hypothetical protein n=1 Tax=Conchiformibius steedae TaxID=153493 RepID=UPI0026F299C0